MESDQEFEDFEDEDFDELEDQDQGPNIRQLRERAARVDQAEARTASLLREKAFLQSGIDTARPLGAWFTAHYDGPVEDLEQLVAEAKSYGIPFKGDPLVETALE